MHYGVPMWLLGAALAQTPLDAVVFVQQGSSACAGTLIEDGGTVLTAYHCVVTGGRPRITTRDGRVTIGRVRRVDRGRDLALIDVPGLAGSTVLQLGPPPATGDVVRAMGHPYGTDVPLGFFAGTLRWSVSEGTVSALGERAVQTTAPINPGNSGGPLVDAEDRVVAVVSRKLRGDGLGFAGRVDDRADWLELPKRWMGLGGTLGGEVLLQANGLSALPLSVGFRAELALRDRVVVSAAATLPLGIKWQALQLGGAEHEPGEVRVALRQRLFRGSWAVRLDGFAALAAIESYQRRGESIDLTSEVRARPLVGGRIGFRNIGLEYGTTLERVPFARMQLTLRWPGTIAIL